MFRCLFLLWRLILEQEQLFSYVSLTIGCASQTTCHDGSFSTLWGFQIFMLPHVLILRLRVIGSRVKEMLLPTSSVYIRAYIVLPKRKLLHTVEFSWRRGLKSFSLKITSTGAGEMAWQLGMHAAKAEGQSLVPSSYIKQFTVASSTGSRESDALSWLPQVTT